MRSLILAGGGMKVGYQAGVMQVLLDEAGLKFDHVDGTSGGCFNLAMLQSGLTGTEIADNWRRTGPFHAVSLQWFWRYLMPWALPSLMTYGRFRRRLLPRWRVDFDRIRQSSIKGTYNVFNFTQKRPQVLTERDITPELFFACVALPMFFPAVRSGGETFIDNVFYNDANIAEAVRRGADEIWVIWTVNETPAYRNNFYRQYFHVIEVTADSRFYEIRDAIERVNEAVRSGRDKRHREIKLHVIRHQAGPVPLDYLVYFRAKQMSRIVDLGIEDARRYLAEAGISTEEAPATPPHSVGLAFRETMAGLWVEGTAPPSPEEVNAHGSRQQIALHLTISIDDLDRFIADAGHTGAVTGDVECEALGGRCTVERGEFNLFVRDGASAGRLMRYRLPFRAPDGTAYLLDGEKTVRDDPGFDLWSDTTTLPLRLYRAGEETPFGSGVVRLRLQDLLKQLTTFRVSDGHGIVSDAQALAKFGRFFFGQLWDEYVAPLSRR